MARALWTLLLAVIGLLAGFLLTMSALSWAHATESSHCVPLAKVKTDLGPKTKFTPLTPGQFHFAEGVYVGSPSTPDGLPPATGALLAEKEGMEGGLILWTRGTLTCGGLALTGDQLKLVRGVKTGKDETGDSI
jgi:hypothetical protein